MAKGESWGNWPRQMTPMFGFGVQTIGGKCLVREIAKKSPAAEGDIRIGDEVKTVAGKEVATLRDIQSVLARRNPGDEITLELVRGGRAVTRKLALVPRR